MAGQRIDYIDCAKGLGIILVVIGHVIVELRVWFLSTPSAHLNSVYQVIYTFHMPLFFFLIGIIAFHSRLKRKFSKFITTKIQSVLYPYFVWSLILFGIVMLQMHGNSIIAEFLKIFYAPNWYLWFLYTLFIFYFLYGLFPINKLGHLGLLFVALASFVWLKEVQSDSRFPYAIGNGFIYFVLGSVFSFLSMERFLIKLKYSINIAILGVMFGLFFMAFHVSVESNPPIVSFLLALIGILIMLNVAIALCKTPLFPALSYVGRRSISIYLAHNLIIVVTMKYISYSALRCFNGWILFTVGVTSGVLCPLLLYEGGRKIRFNWLFEWSSSERFSKLT